MKELLAQLEDRMQLFAAEASKIENKAAAARARKVSLELEKLLKQYRKDSVK